MMKSDDELLPTTLLSNADMLETILKQLSPKALGLAECTCRDIRIAATSSSGVWLAVATHHIQGPLSRCPDECSFWKQLCCEVCRQQRDDLVHRVVTSSVDRDEENGSNLLTASTCAGATTLAVAARCGCADGVACYWSSAAIEDGDAAHETLGLWPAPKHFTLVSSVRLQPYRSRDQPSVEDQLVTLPIYAPCAAYVRSTSSQLRTPTVSVAHNDTLQTIARFEPPLLLLPGDSLSVELRGAAQRCPTIYGTTDFYICVSHVAMRGHSFQFGLLYAVRCADAGLRQIARRLDKLKS